MEESIEEEIMRKFGEAIRSEREVDNSKRKKGLHVSNLSYGCKRNSWYGLNYEIKKEESIESIYRMWIGTKLHETPITENHEFKLETKIDGIDLTGSIDEIMETSRGKVLIDKKFQQKLPTSMYEHHRMQILFYAVLLNDLKNIKVDSAAIYYFLPQMNIQYDRNSNPLPRAKVFLIQITDSILDEYRKLLYDMVNDIVKKYKDNDLPEKYVSFFCNYCPFKKACDLDMREIE